MTWHECVLGQHHLFLLEVSRKQQEETGSDNGRIPIIVESRFLGIQKFEGP